MQISRSKVAGSCREERCGKSKHDSPQPEHNPLTEGGVTREKKRQWHSERCRAIFETVWWGAQKSPGIHTTAREPKRAHLRVPAFKNNTKKQREDPEERKTKWKIVAGVGKKRVKFWAVPAEGGSGRGRSGWALKEWGR